MRGSILGPADAAAAGCVLTAPVLATAPAGALAPIATAALIASAVSGSVGQPSFNLARSFSSSAN